jgi:polyisoprenyl-phosphate glycosyltransferase
LVAIVIPAYNEEAAIASTVTQIRDALRSLVPETYEILVVDDGSVDGTSSRAEEAGARVIRHLHNLGYGRALKTGILAANYDTIVIMDGDGTYPATAIPELLAKYRQGYDMVVGARTGEHYRESPLKWLLRRTLRTLVEWVGARDIPDINSGFRAFSRSKTIQFLPRLSDGFSFTTSLTLTAVLNYMFVAYVPVAYYERVGRSKVRLFRDSWRSLKTILLMMLYHTPLTIFFSLSVISLIGALMSVVIGITFQMLTGFVMGVASIMLAGLIFSIGLVADLLRRILDKR